jgi:hypothetical protein
MFFRLCEKSGAYTRTITAILFTIAVSGCVADNTTQKNSSPGNRIGEGVSTVGVLQVLWDQQDFFAATEVCYAETKQGLHQSSHSKCMAKTLGLDLNRLKIDLQKYKMHGDRVVSYCRKKLGVQFTVELKKSGLVDPSQMKAEHYRCLGENFQVQQVVSSVATVDTSPAAAARYPTNSYYNEPMDIMGSAIRAAQTNLSNLNSMPNPYLEQQQRRREERMRAEANDVECVSTWIENRLHTNCK